MFASSHIRSISCGSFSSFPNYASGALRAALSAVGGRSRLGHVWLFPAGAGSAQVVLGAYRLALAAGHSVSLEAPRGPGGFWFLYVS
jgi:hypothetical protein